MELTRKEDAVRLALTSARTTLLKPRLTTSWGGKFELDYGGHTALVSWAMAGANFHRMVGVRRPLAPAATSKR